MCNGRCGGGVCGSWGKGSHLGSRGARPARRGKRRAVGLRQWRSIDVAEFLKTQETGSPHHPETFMHKVSVIVHCVLNNFFIYNHTRNLVLLYHLFQENKSLGSKHQLHSSSDVREVVSSTIWYMYFYRVNVYFIETEATSHLITFEYLSVIYIVTIL
jgi:hypothetical protein